MLHGGEIYDKKIDLDFSVNLNPNPCPEEVRQALVSAVDDVIYYPDIHQRRFREAVCRAENNLYGAGHNRPGDTFFTPENVLGGNGASELLFAIVNMLCPKKVLIPAPCFYGYIHAVNMIPGAEIKTYSLREDDGYRLTEEFTDSITEDTDLVIIGNPNNPTGKCIEKVVLKKIILRCAEVGCKLIVDECFIRLSRACCQPEYKRERAEVGDLKAGDVYASARSFIKDFDGMFVVDAYTKLFSIPGARIGFVLSQEGNIQKLEGYLPEWNMSVFAQRAGEVCARIMTEDNYISESLEIIEAERRFLTYNLSGLGFRVFDSDANFMLVKRSGNPYYKLLEKKILIRDCSNFMGLEKNYYRIAIREHGLNDILVREIEKIYYSEVL